MNPCLPTQFSACMPHNNLPGSVNIKQNVCSDTKVVIYPNSSVYPAADPTRFAGASRHLSMHVRMSTHTHN